MRQLLLLVCVASLLLTQTDAKRIKQHKSNELNNDIDAVDRTIYVPNEDISSYTSYEPESYDPLIHGDKHQQYPEEQQIVSERQDEVEPIQPIEYIQLGVLGITAFGFSILAFQLLFRLTTPVDWSVYKLEKTLLPFLPIIQDVFNEVDNREVSSLTDRILQSMEPVDMTFGILGMEDSCRHRVICEMTKYINMVPFLENVWKLYGPQLSLPPKYEFASNAGKAFDDCQTLYPRCDLGIEEKISNLL